MSVCVYVNVFHKKKQYLEFDDDDDDDDNFGEIVTTTYTKTTNKNPVNLTTIAQTPPPLPATPTIFRQAIDNPPTFTTSTSSIKKPPLSSSPPNDEFTNQLIELREKINLLTAKDKSIGLPPPKPMATGGESSNNSPSPPPLPRSRPPTIISHKTDIILDPPVEVQSKPAPPPAAVVKSVHFKEITVLPTDIGFQPIKTSRSTDNIAVTTAVLIKPIPRYADGPFSKSQQDLRIGEPQEFCLHSLSRSYKSSDDLLLDDIDGIRRKPTVRQQQRSKRWKGRSHENLASVSTEDLLTIQPRRPIKKPLPLPRTNSFEAIDDDAAFVTEMRVKTGKMEAATSSSSSSRPLTVTYVYSSDKDEFVLSNGDGGASEGMVDASTVSKERHSFDNMFSTERNSNVILRSNGCKYYIIGNSTCDV